MQRMMRINLYQRDSRDLGTADRSSNGTWHNDHPYVVIFYSDEGLERNDEGANISELTHPAMMLQNILSLR